MRFIFFMIHLILSVAQNSLLIIFGPKTPAILRELYSNVTSMEIDSFLEPSIKKFLISTSLIFDLSLEPTSQIFIYSKSGSFDAPCLSLSKSSITDKSSDIFSAFPSVQSEVKALSEMIKYLEWEQMTVFLSNSIENILSLDLLRNQFSKFQIKSQIYSANASEYELDCLVKSYLKLTKDHNLLVLDQGPTLQLLIKLLNQRKIGKFGKYILFGPSYICPHSIEGSISLCYQHGLNSTTLDQFYMAVVKNVTENLKLFDKKELEKKCPSYVCFPDILIVNQRNNELKLVGIIKDVVKIYEKIIFPGNNTEMKAGFIKTSIPILIANGTREPDGFENSEITSRYYYGALFAAERANSLLKPEGYEYELVPTDCGNLNSNFIWTIECLSKYSKTKSVAYVTSYWAGQSIINLLAFRTFAQFLPQVSPDGLSDFLNNQTDYPEFVKLSSKIEYNNQNSIFLFLFNNWKKLIYLSVQDESLVEYYETTKKIMENMGVSILNPEELRFLPKNYTRDDFEKYRHIFQFIKDSRCRIILLLSSISGYLLEGLYDIGLRRGDVIIIDYFIIYFSLIENIEEKYLNKRREIAYGAIVYNNLQYEGEFGKEIENILKQKHGSTLNMCMTFDAFLTISNSIEYIISKGDDYEDPQLLIKTIRNQKFVGCSGNIYFVPGENSRDKIWLGYFQVIIDPKTNQVDMIQILALNKFATIAARQINEPMWPTGEKTVPSNFRPIQVCVYENQPQISKYGRLSLHIISMIYLIFVIIVAIISYKKFNYSVAPLTEDVHLSYNDLIHQLFLICEFFQILSLEPREGLISKSTKDLHLKFGLDLITAFDLKFNDFWTFYTLLLVICGLWSILAALSVIIKKEVLQSNQYLFILRLLSNSIIPIIGHLCYLPISLMLLSIYKCEEGISDELVDSFIERDCSKFCYQGKHIQLVITSTVTSVIFLSVSTYLRPYWELSHQTQHLRSRASYFSVLSVFQFVLVLIKVNFENISKIFQGFMTVGSLILLNLITIRMRPYNYEKTYVFQITILSLCTWNMILTSVSFLINYENQLKITYYIGMALILGLGYKISARYRSKFISDNTYAIPILIKFQFSKNNFSNTMRENSFYKEVEKKRIHKLFEKK